MREEKTKQKEMLKELKKPKEDLECDDLAPVPTPTPVKSKLTQAMFGDAVMILEFLNQFGELFELSDDFPTGLSLELLENALFSKTYDSALCNLLLFYLDSIFKCYDEEHFDGESGLESELDDSSDELAEEGDQDEAEGAQDKIHLEQVWFAFFFFLPYSFNFFTVLMKFNQIQCLRTFSAVRHIFRKKLN